jgi:molybdenum cofactor biosynthesis enzyme
MPIKPLFNQGQYPWFVSSQTITVEFNTTRNAPANKKQSFYLPYWAGNDAEKIMRIILPSCHPVPAVTLSEAQNLAIKRQPKILPSCNPVPAVHVRLVGEYTTKGSAITLFFSCNSWW